ncbi:hypothetical protein HY504_02820 [Candidatus Wolfebacteria bacterium]|nr:hypothetical protein [Candidatus Wolfebacteria bacterium]
MKIAFSKKALREYLNLSTVLRKAAVKQFGFLLKNLKHPSLRAKKYDETKDIWQARITKSWRFYFQIRGDVYYIITIIPHPQ